MGQAIGDLLPLAIAVALSPIAIIAIVLMLATPRGKVNGAAFTLGWLAGLTVVVTIVLVGESGSATEDSGEPATWTSVVQLVLGVLFLLLAVRQWQTRPRAGEQREQPKWMRTIDRFTPGKAFGLAVLLATVGKNTPLAIGAAIAIAQAGLSAGEEVVAAAVFLALASLTIFGPLVLYVLGGAGAKAFLDEIKDWMAAHNAAIMIVLFLVLGLKFAGDGIAGL